MTQKLEIKLEYINGGFAAEVILDNKVINENLFCESMDDITGLIRRSARLINVKIEDY